MGPTPSAASAFLGRPGNSLPLQARSAGGGRTLGSSLRCLRPRPRPERSSLRTHPQDEVISVPGKHICIHHKEHTNGQEVPEGNQVPQAVKAVVPEEELGASQKRRPVLGLWRGLGRQHTCSETHVLAGEPSPPGLRKRSQTHTHASTHDVHHTLLCNSKGEPETTQTATDSLRKPQQNVTQA